LYVLLSDYLQVAVLLKECQDIQLRCGSSLSNVGHGAFSMTIRDDISNDESSSHEHVILILIVTDLPVYHNFTLSDATI
jgi:hypothetical protein